MCSCMCVEYHRISETNAPEITTATGREVPHNILTTTVIPDSPHHLLNKEDRVWHQTFPTKWPAEHTLFTVCPIVFTSPSCLMGLLPTACEHRIIRRGALHTQKPVSACQQSTADSGLSHGAMAWANSLCMLTLSGTLFHLSPVSMEENATSV